MLKRKTIFIILLSLLFCYCLTLATGATTLTAKDLVITKIKNFDSLVNTEFYKKSSGQTNIVVNKFDGIVKDELGDYQGSTIDLLTQLDEPNKLIRVNYAADIQGSTFNGDIYLQDDQVILTKDICYLLQEMFPGAFSMNAALLEQAPQYLYFTYNQLQDVWTQTASYQNQQLPEEYREMLLFLVEAIPDEYFSLSTDKVTLKLDQVGLEDFIYNLFTKIKDEKERFAGIVVGVNRYFYLQTEGSPEEMKQEIISGLANITFPTKEEIQEISNYLQLADFTYESSLIPGGTETFNMVINFNYNEINGAGFNGSINYNIKYTDSTGEADLDISATAKDNSTGELIFDVGAACTSVSKVDNEMVLSAPEMNAQNSLDITSLLLPKPKNYVNLIVNGRYIAYDVQPFIKDGRTMVPVRFVADALGCDVQWIEPNEVRITGADKVISMYIGQYTYRVNGVDKILDVVPFIEAGRTMVPVRFIAEELGAQVELIGCDVHINKY